MLREELPALSHAFGIKGADLPAMPIGEIQEYLEQLPRFLPRVEE